MIESPNTTTTSRRHLLIIIGTAILLIITDLIGLPLDATTPLEGLELSARDTAFRLRGVRDPAEEIVIVAIDDPSLVWLDEHWPWSRARIAEIINWLDDAGARVIGLDMFLFDPAPNPADDEALVEALANARSAVSVNQIIRRHFTETHEPPLDIYQEVLDGFGITEVRRDDDSIVRGIRAYNTFGDKVYYNWGFEVARAYLGVDPPSNPSDWSVTFNGSVIPLNTGQLMLVDFAGPAGTYPTYSAAFVPLGDYPPEVFRDKIVLIGATSITLQDIYPTPHSATSLMPGVEVIANTVATLLSGQYLRLAPPWTTIALTILAALMAWFIIKIPRPTTSIVLLLGSMAIYFLIRHLIFIQAGWQIAMITPQLMLFLGVVLPTLEQAVTQEIEKRRVRTLFSRFISPEMVSQIIETQDIDSLNKRTELTILFSDIRGFTTLSERLTPEEVVALLNPYLEAMSSVIHKHGGTIDKYEGDAIIAFFGEPMPYPDHANRAARAAIEMRQMLEQLREQWREEGRFVDKFEMGIGLNTGEVFVGLVGSEQRVNYTIIGDNANLAARLQDVTKEINWPVLISGKTYEKVKDEFEVEFVESRVLRGKTEPVEIYKLIGAKGMQIKPTQPDIGTRVQF